MSAENDDIIDAVAASISKPKRARTEAGETEHHDLSDKVAAAQFVIGQRAAKKSPFSRIRSVQVELPGGCN